MIELNLERMSKATEKARKVRNHVRMIAFRKYEVKTPEGHLYTVTFDAQAGKKLAGCTCAAGTNNQMCYHVAGAVVLHLAIAYLRAKEEKAAQQVSEQKATEQKPVERTPRPILVKKECDHITCKTTRCQQGQNYEGIAI